MKTKEVKCKICGSHVKRLFNSKVLGRYKITYYKCTNCGLIQTEKPYWLKEAYSSALIDSDTGVLSRNITLSKITAAISLLFLRKNAKVLDYGGGYGILTRMLRDIGVDCYWSDKYAENIFAKGFEGKSNARFDAVTAFELFEHLENPVDEVEKILKKYKPKMLLFSTMLHNGNPPKDWWYFVPEGGQHITLYTKKSLEILAGKFGMKLSTNGRNVHLFSKKKIPGLLMKMVSVLWPFVSVIFPFFYSTQTVVDHKKLIGKHGY